MELQDLYLIVEKYGLPTMLLVAAVWWGYVRERRLEARLDSLNEFVRDKLMGALDRNNQMLERNNQIMILWKMPTFRDPSDERSTP